MNKWKPGDDPVQIGRWVADPRSDELLSDTEIVKLEPIKMRLLLALAEHPGEVLLTDELMARVWGDTVVSPSSVYQGIAQLRRILGDGAGAAKYIETMPRKGYRLIARVVRRSRDSAAARAAAQDRDALPGLADPRDPPAPVEPPPLADLPGPVGHAEPSSEAPAPPIAHASVGAWSPSRRRWLVAAALGLGGAGAASLWRGLATSPPALPIRLAVLPFTDRTAGAAEAAVSQGLALDVIRSLERFPGIFVTAADSALAVTGDASLSSVARRLTVHFVLAGELLESAMRVRVKVRLVAIPGEVERWVQEFEQSAASMAGLPDAIASAAAAALSVPAVAMPASSGRVSADAYALYLLGNHAWRAKTPEAFGAARGYFQRGIEVDPGFARNYLGIGWTWLGQATNGGGLDWDAAFARATPLFDKALRLDPDSAEALTAQGVLRAASNRFDDARALFARALLANPGYAQVHHSLGVAEFDDGWPQRAIPHFQRAVELNPLSLSPLDRLGLALVTNGQQEAARTAYRRAVALEPAHPNGYWGLGIQAYAEGDLDRAVPFYREALRHEERRPYVWGELACILMDLNEPAHALDAIHHSARLLPASPWPRLLEAYAWLVQDDRGAPPPVLDLTAEAVPEDENAIDVMMIRAMAGLPLDEHLLQRGVDAATARGTAIEPMLWVAFQGFHAAIDLATVYAVLGKPERGRPYLDLARRQIDRYERQGNAWHALSFHRARLLALLGDQAGALRALTAAVAQGSRRGWRLRLDPSFASLRGSPAFIAAAARIDAAVRRQRVALRL